MYLTIRKTAELSDLTPKVVRGRVHEIRSEPRYSGWAVIGEGKSLRINYLAWVDYWKYRSRLKDKNLRKYVPEYRPEEIRKELGYGDFGQDIPHLDTVIHRIG